MNQNYATSKSMQFPFTPKIISQAGLRLEYNPNINMYRMGGAVDIPADLMGYSPHKSALIDRAFKWARSNAAK